MITHEPHDRNLADLMAVLTKGGPFQLRSAISCVVVLLWLVISLLLGLVCPLGLALMWGGLIPRLVLVLVLVMAHWASLF